MGGHCAPPRPFATGHGSPAASSPVTGGDRCRPAERGWRRPRAYLVPSVPRKKAASRQGRCSVSGCRPPVSGSAPGPRPGGAGGVPLVSRGEQSRSEPRGQHSDLRAGRAEALLAPSTPLGQAHRRDAGKPGGLRPERRGLAETEPSRGLAARRHLRARDGWCPIPAGTTTLREGRSVPSAATCSSFQGRRGPGPRRRRRRREQVALPAPSRRTQASRKRADTELMRLSSQSPIHRDCSLHCCCSKEREKCNEVVC